MKPSYYVVCTMASRSFTGPSSHSGVCGCGYFVNIIILGSHHDPRLEHGLEVLLLDKPSVDEFPLLIGVLEADLEATRTLMNTHRRDRRKCTQPRGAEGKKAYLKPPQ